MLIAGAFHSLCLCRLQTLQRATGQDIANLLWGLGHIYEKQQQHAGQSCDSGMPPSCFFSADQLLVLAMRLLEVCGAQGQQGIVCCVLRHLVCWQGDQRRKMACI